MNYDVRIEPVLGWKHICIAYGRQYGIASERLQVLHAFAKTKAEDVEGGLTLKELRAQTIQEQEAMGKQLRVHLANEVDQEQANMFARRYLSVQQFLSSLAIASVEAQIFQVALHQRVCEILAHAESLALRVRAVVDFYYSQAAMIKHRQLPSSSLAALVNRVDWHSIGSHLQHAVIRGHSSMGPVYINVIRGADLRLEARDMRMFAGDFIQQVQQAGATAGVSGGFFLYSEPDICPPSQRTDPVGWLLSAGKVQNPPVFQRAAVVQNRVGDIDIWVQGMKGVRVQPKAGDWIDIAASNCTQVLGKQLVAFNRAFGDTIHYAGLSVVLVGRRVLQLTRGEVAIPLAGLVLCVPPEEATRWNAIKVGDVLHFSFPHLHGQPLHNAMAGGPMLLHPKLPVRQLLDEDFAHTAPPITFSQDETFDQNLLPRMALGITPQNEVVLAAIDGRNVEKAPGMTLQQTAQLMHLLGCEKAMNLDGGSSKRMVVEGRMVDLATTEVVATAQQPSHLRPVHSALLLFVPTV